MEMKKIRQTLWAKGFFIYAIKATFFQPILLKLVQIIYIIVRINPIENQANPSNIYRGKGAF